MTVKLDMDDLFSSDILLYELLQEKKIDNPVLHNFFISFPSEEQIINRQYGIFIGDMENILTQRTSSGDEYEATVRVVVTSKQKDFKLAKTGIDLATKEIIKEIRNSKLGRRGFRWTRSKIIYDESLALKHRQTDFIFDEMYAWEDVDYDERGIELIFGDVKLEENIKVTIGED